MESGKIKMRLKLTSNQSEIEIEFPAEISLEELKSECCRKIGEEVEVKLIFKGKILKTDEDVAILRSGETLYIVKEVKKPQNVNPPTLGPISSGAGNMTGLLSGLNNFEVMNQARGMLSQMDNLEPENELNIDPNQMAMISQMMANPMMRDMVMNTLQQTMRNPEMRQMMINSNPTLKRLSETNPGILDMMGDPMVVEQMKGMLQRMSLGSSAGPLSGDASSFPSPGGAGPTTQSSVPGTSTPASSPFTAQSTPAMFNNPFASMMFGGAQPSQVPPQNVPNPFSPSTNPNQFTPPSTPYPGSSNPSVPQPNPFMNNPFLQMMMNTPPANNAAIPNTNQPSPNMQNQPNPFMNQFMQMMGGFGSGTPPQSNPGVSPWGGSMGNLFTPPTAAANNQNLRQVYAVQLQSMRDMGFINDEANIVALKETGGNVNAAVERLLNMLG